MSNRMFRSGLIAGSMAAMALIITVSMAMSANLSTIMLLLALGAAPAIVTMLLAGSAWLYERPMAAPNKAPAAAASTQEYLFEAPPPPINQDDVLISMAEKNQ